MELKIAFLIIVASVSNALATPGYSQVAKVSLDMENKSLEQVMDEIERQSEFYFIFNQKQIDVNRVVDIQVENKLITDILPQLFNGTNVNYAVLDRKILLTTDPLENNLLAIASGTELQQVTVRGTVTDASTGEALPGVNVVVWGTTTGVMTNVTGNYTLAVPSASATLVYSFIGYVTQEIAIGGRTTLDVTLVESVSYLDEVVVIGYGVRERGVITGSVAYINEAEIIKSTSTNMLQSLQGKLPGVIISDRGGEPGSESVSFLIRGTHSLGSSSPLTVIDGVAGMSFAHLSPNDIKSITILKDAAASIYGARAANGVIVIETKRGSKGKAVLEYNGSYGVSSFTRAPQMMDSYQYAIYKNEVEERYGRQPQWSEDDIEKFKSGNKPLTHPNTDWYGITLKDWASETHHNLNASGGGENVNYFLSGDYLSSDGMYKTGDMYYRQYQIRSNVDAQISKYLNVGLNLFGKLENTHSSQYGAAGMFSRIQRAQPFMVGIFPNGFPGWGSEAGQNPVVMSSDKGGWSDDKSIYVQSKLSFNLNMDWLTKGLSLTGYGVFEYSPVFNELFHNIWDVYHYDEATNEYTAATGYNQGIGQVRDLREISTLTQKNLYHISLKYKRSFDFHNFSGFIAYEQMEGSYSNLQGFKKGLVGDTKIELFTGDIEGTQATGYSTEEGRVNYFGSINYDFNRKYMIDFSLRYDGSFNFAEGKRFGLFPGISVGWAISNEQFMTGTSSWLDFLKIRASWAKMGNDAVSSFQYLTQYSLSTSMGWGWAFGEGAKFNGGIYQANVPNANITWEVADNQNIGIDATFWDEKLLMSFDYFYERRREILIKRSASIPDYTALSLPSENLGKVDNSGIELSLNYQNKVGNINYNLGGNFSYIKNKIVYMDEAANIPEYRKQEGHSVSSFVVYKTDGIFNTWEEIENTEAKLSGTQPGDIKHVDVNGDGKITGEDMVRKYTSQQPEIQYSINAGIGYKGFNLDLFFMGQARAEINILYDDMWGNAPEYLFTERWTEENEYAKFPRAYDRSDGFNCLTSDFWLFNASFLRLKNVVLSYNFPSKWGSGIINGSKVYIKGSNLWTMFDHMPNNSYDPEMTNGTGRYYPQLTKIQIGLIMNL